MNRENKAVQISLGILASIILWLAFRFWDAKIAGFVALLLVGILLYNWLVVRASMRHSRFVVSSMLEEIKTSGISTQDDVKSWLGKLETQLSASEYVEVRRLLSTSGLDIGTLMSVEDEE